MMGLNRRQSCKDHFKSLGILTVPSLFVLSVVLHVKGQLDSYVRVGDNHDYNTRFRNNILIPQHNTTRYEVNPSYIGVRLFEKLPQHVTQADGNKFKTVLKRYLVQKCIYSLDELNE